MTEKNDVYSDVKGQMRLSERIAAFIPGFRGYKEKELRRESDRLIRNHLAMQLSKDKTELRTLSQKLADRRYFAVLTDMDRLNAKMDRVTEKINHAPYGYTGLFDAIKVKEESLDRMLQFDSKLVEDISTLTAEVDAFKADFTAGQTSTLKTRVQTVTDKLDALEDAFDKREEVILGVN
jgi:chromosome segregation ATPase